MSRPKKQHVCRKCNTSFTWETSTGSVRQHNLDGSLHYCTGGYARPSGSPENSPRMPRIEPMQQEESKNPDSLGNQFENADEASSSEAKSESKSEEKAQDSSEKAEQEENKSQAQNSPEEKPNQAAQDLWKLVRPAAIQEVPLKSQLPKVVQELIDAAKQADNRKLAQLLDTFEKRIETRIAESLKPAKIEHEIRLKNADGLETKEIKGGHKQLHELLGMLSVGLNVLLVGPAGSGKTHAAFMCAEALNKTFYPMSVGPQTSKSDLIGYMDATGRCIRTGLREAFEHGGLFLLDEIDAGNPGVLTILNALLANQVVSFPDAVVSKHPGFLCIAAANTYGTGANRMYVGRQQLDAATLDRFVGIDWDYDTDLEVRLADSQPDWCLFVWQLRKIASELALRVVFGTRRIMQGCALLDSGMQREHVESHTVWFGVSADDKAKIVAAMSGQSKTQTRRY